MSNPYSGAAANIIIFTFTVCRFFKTIRTDFDATTNTSLSMSITSPVFAAIFLIYT